jgi:iron complex outermembrane receptor protein
MTRTLAPAVLGIALSPALVLAQAQSDEPAPQTVVVSATRSLKPIEQVPGAVSLISSADLRVQRTLTDDPSAVLATLVPGYAPSRQKATSFGETFRGRGALILFDGVPQTNPLRGGARESYFTDQAVIERIEVIAGANALQGLGATGGLINYVSRNPTRDGLENRLELRHNSQFKSDTGGWGVSYTGAYKAEAWDVLLQAGGQRRGMNVDGNGRLMGIDNTQGDTMDSTAENLFVKLGYNGRGFRLQGSYNSYQLEGDGNYRLQPGDRARGLTTTSVRGAPVGNPIKNEVETGNLMLLVPELGGGSLSAQVFTQKFASSFGAGIFAAFQDASIAPVGTLVDQSEITADKTGIKAAYTRSDFLTAGLSLTLGLDVLHDTTNQRLAATGRLFVPNLELRNTAPFVQFEYELGRFTATAGLRSERVRLDVPAYRTLAFYNNTEVAAGSQSFTENVPSLGVIYRFSPGLSAFASASRGFGLSDVGLVLRAVNQPGQNAGRLVDLKPVVVDNREVGISFKRGNFSGSASYYISESELGTAIQTDSFGIPFVVRRPTKIKGLEATLAYTVSGLRVDTTYARMRGRTASTNGGEIDSDLGIVSQSPDKLTAGVNWRALPALTLRLQGSKLFDRELNAGRSNAESFKGYTLVDVSASYATRLGSFALGIENLTDRFWVGPFPQSNAGSRTNNSDYFAGRGRTYMLSWTHLF